MRIVVLGVGRSGTSALFNLLQDMCVDEFDNKVDFVYEPFLWNRKVFNKVYSEYKNEFSLSSSLSIDGMYNNKHIPQFVDKNNLAKFEHNKFLNDLARPMKGMDCLLAKYIRGNGRYLLLKKICPDCKFIFMMRNPLDTLNSSINMFSFLGDDFYESDWEMLANEIYDKYNDQVHDQFKTRLSKELAYWFYMNKFLLENSVGDDILKICYEDYIQNKRQYLKNICSFLNIEFKDSYYQRSLDSVREGQFR